MKRVKVGGTYFKIVHRPDPRALDPNAVAAHTTSWCWGETDYSARTIRLWDGADKDVRAVTFYHELAHAIVDAYHIKSMRNEDGTHDEDNIDRLAVGLKEAMQSLGVDILPRIVDKKK